MKTLIICFCLCLSTSSFSQANAIKRGERFNEVYTITAIDSNELYLWVGTDNGLFRITKRNKRRKFYSLSNTGHTENQVTGLHCTKDGCVWVGTNHGLVKYDCYGFIPFTTENSNLPENFITSVAGAGENEVLVGTAHNGLFRLRGSRFHPEPASKKVIAASQRIALAPNTTR